MHDEPIDPFAGDPADPSNELADLDDMQPSEDDDPLTTAEREDVMEDLADLEIYQTLLTPVGVRGLVIECEDCHEPHYFDWDLLRGNLRHLLDSGRPRVHEPAYDPDPDHYVTWEYARGYADGVHDTLTDEDADAPHTGKSAKSAPAKGETGDGATIDDGPAADGGPADGDGSAGHRADDGSAAGADGAS